MNGALRSGLVAATAGLLSVSSLRGQAPQLTLADAIRLGLDNNPQVGVSAGQRSAAEAGLGQAKSRWWPTLNFNGVVSRNNLPMLVFPIHALDATAFEFDQTLVQSQTVLDFTIFDGGARTSQIALARSSFGIADAAADAAETDLIERIAAAYLLVLAAAEIDEAQGRRIAALEAEEQRVQQLLDAGRAARVELLRAQAALSEANADRVGTTTDAENASRDLARMIGVEPARVAARLLVDVTPDGATPESRESLSARAFDSNPRVQQAQQNLAAEQAAVRIAKASWIPSLHLGATMFTYASPQTDFRFEWQGRLGISYPIFTGFDRSNRVAQANARVETAQSELRLLELEVESVVDRAIAAIEANDARVSALAQVVGHLTEVRRIEQLALDVGTGVQTDYLRAEADLFAARAQLVRTRTNAIAARVSLARAVGDLSPEWIAMHLEDGP